MTQSREIPRPVVTTPSLPIRGCHDGVARCRGMLDKPHTARHHTTRV